MIKNILKIFNKSKAKTFIKSIFKKIYYINTFTFGTKKRETFDAINN